MSLSFAIVPFLRSHNSYAYELQNKIKNNIISYVDVDVDTEYDAPLSLRITGWKRQEYNVITIDDDYINNNTIIVRCFDKGSKPEEYDVDDFIELIASFEDTNQSETKTESKTETKTDESNCIIS